MKRIVTLFLLAVGMLWVATACSGAAPTTIPSPTNEAGPVAAPTEPAASPSPAQLPSPAQSPSPAQLPSPAATATAPPPPTEPPTAAPTDEPTATDEPSPTEPPATATAPAATAPAATAPAATAPAATAPAATGAAAVAIEDFQFSPANLNVAAGTTVTWTHLGEIRHTVTADDGSFDSPTLSGGDTFEVTFDTPGTYAYYCRFHGGAGQSGMAGVIVVTE